MPTIDPKIAWPGWETVRLIGRGSFGSVYEIQRDVLGEKEKAALKVITIPQSSSDIDELYGEGYDDASITSTFQEHLKSIVAEYSLMRKLNGSSYVVNCDDVRYVQHEDGIGWDIFIKMELLTALNKALGETIPEEQVIRIGADICRALRLCRKHNIIHRDIKPANIFVSENGDYKLGDFGIAKTVEKTSGGTKIGTYEYMAPEVYHDEPYGAAADIYSLGMVLYWLLNERRTPFLQLPPALPTTSEKERARKRRFSGEEIPSPAHGSPALQRIVLKAIAYDQKDRYQSAEKMLRDLEAAGGDSGSDPHEGLHGTQEQISAGAGPDMSTGAGEEDATVGLFGTGRAKTVTAVANAAGDTQKPETEAAEEATVGLYGVVKTKGTAPVEQEPDSIEKQTAREEKNGAPIEAQHSPASERAAGRLPFAEPDPDEEATIGVLGRQTTKPATPVKPTEAVRPATPAKTRPAPERHAAKASSGKTNKKKIGLIAGTVGVLVAAAVLLLVLLPGITRGGSSSSSSSGGASSTGGAQTAASNHVHEWTEATCDKPRTCKTCGETDGFALGHDWGSWTRVTDPTCLSSGKEIRICRNDSSHQESRKVDNLGHDWIPATYDAPKTCSRCGTQEGEIKGYIGYLDGDYGNPVQLSNIGFYAFELDEEVYNCRKLWMNLYVEGNGANSYGRWYVFCRELNGKWQKLGEVTITKDNEGEWVLYEVEMYGTFTFDALTVSPDHYIYESGTVGMEFWAQVNVD